MTDPATSAATAQAAPGSGDPVAVFTEHRGLLFSVAYRMLGQAGDAEDVVQEAWLRWDAADRAQVRDARAYLVRVVTRLSIDRMRQIAARRESYPGQWLPEPLRTRATEPALPDNAAEQAERADSLSLALLVVLETLSPLERAVFVLREAFDTPYAEIAAAVGRSEAAVRQLLARARAHVRERRPRYDTDQAIRRQVTQRFLDACAGDDMDALLQLLAPGVVVVGDGGGYVPTARKLVTGQELAARFLLNIARRHLPGLTVEVVDNLNAGPGILGYSNGTPAAAVAVDLADGRIEAVHIVLNPEKLRHVGETWAAE